MKRSHTDPYYPDVVKPRILLFLQVVPCSFSEQTSAVFIQCYVQEVTCFCGDQGRSMG